MKREIKFREWNGYEMNYEPMVSLVSTASINDRFPDNDIMQFTGLLDKNGKEIFEGDIVRVEECECIGHSADGSKEEWRPCEGEVSFEGSMFVFEGHSAGTVPLDAYEYGLEIVGNIYESPELLITK